MSAERCNEHRTHCLDIVQTAEHLPSTEARSGHGADTLWVPRHCLGTLLKTTGYCLDISKPSGHLEIVWTPSRHPDPFQTSSDTFRTPYGYCLIHLDAVYTPGNCSDTQILPKHYVKPSRNLDTIRTPRQYLDTLWTSPRCFLHSQTQFRHLNTT